MARIELLVRAISVPALWLAAVTLGDRVQQLPTICLWKRLTGFECYGCGMGRALVAAFRGDLAGAYHWHHLVFVAIGCLLHGWWTAVIDLSREHTHERARRAMEA